MSEPFSAARVPSDTAVTGVTGRRRRRPGRMVLVAGVLAVSVLGACGGGSDTATETTGSGTKGSGLSVSGDSESTTSAAASATTAKTGSSAPATTAATKGTISASEVADDLTAAFNAVAKGDCTRAQTIADRIDSSDIGSASLTALAEGLKKAAANGPSEIRPDLKVFSEAMGKLVVVYAKYGLDDPSKIASIANDPAKVAELQAAAAAMDDPAVQKASDNIEKWVNARCPQLGGTTK